MGGWLVFGIMDRTMLAPDNDDTRKEIVAPALFCLLCGGNMLELCCDFSQWIIDPAGEHGKPQSGLEWFLFFVWATGYTFV